MITLPDAAERHWMPIAGACAWAAFLSIGAKYPAYLGCALLSAIALTRQKRWRQVLRQPGIRAALAFWGLVLLSATWSTAEAGPLVSQVGLYALPLFVPLIAAAVPKAAAQFALRQFAIVAAVVGAATVLDRAGLLPLKGTLLWYTTVEAHGNQRIVNSLVLSLGAALGLLHLIQPVQTSKRVLWLLAFGLAIAGLVSQDRRTGMVALPVMLAVLGLARQRSAWRGVLVIALVAALSLAAWQFSSGVRGRIDEGLNELRIYQSADTSATSWGMRVRLAERTLEMVRDEPLLGHGVGSWIGEWRRRVQPGLLISHHSTPHNEYLLVTAQFGLVGLALFGWLLAGHLRHAWRAGPDGHACLLVWSAIAWAGLFNVVIRDSRFSLALLMIAGFAGALIRRQAAEAPGPAPLKS